MADYAFKVILIGPGAVGKTSLLDRFVHNKFSERYELTIGVDFLSKDVEVNGLNIRMTIWDVGGQERFKFMRNRFYDGANGALLVFDLTRSNTYTEIKKWLKEFQQHAGSNVPFVLIGNKKDLVENIGEIIESKDAKKFAEEKNSIYIETSAKTGVNVEDSFIGLAQKMVKPFKK